MDKGIQLFFLNVGLSTAKSGIPQGHILTRRQEGSDLKTLVEDIGTAPDGLTIDPEHQHIYYTNRAVPSRNSGSISRVSSIAGSLCSSKRDLKILRTMF